MFGCILGAGKFEIRGIFGHFGAVVLCALVMWVHPAGATSATSSLQTQPSSAVESSNVLTYHAWKNLRIDEARLVLDRMTFESQVEAKPQTKSQIERSPVENAAIVKSGAKKGLNVVSTVFRGSRSGRLEQSRMNLEIAEELTVNDYVAIYLSQFKSRDVLLDVARRMAPEEVTDLLLSYQKLVSGGQIAEHSATLAPRLSPRPL